MFVIFSWPASIGHRNDARREKQPAKAVYSFLVVPQKCVNMSWATASLFCSTLKTPKKHPGRNQSTRAKHQTRLLLHGKSANSPTSGARATCDQGSMQLSLLLSQPCQGCTNLRQVWDVCLPGKPWYVSNLPDTLVPGRFFHHRAPCC